MFTVDATGADCFVYTYREGLLSRVGHDLKLRVSDFTITADGDRLTAVFDPGSIETVCAMRRGTEDPTALSERDRRQIEDNLHDQVLPARGGAIRFEAALVAPRGDRWSLPGQLTLNGVTRPLTPEIVRRGDRWTTRVRLTQSDYGIKPFRALLGTLRIQSHVDVELSLPVAAVPPG
jgi:hypothetical protein